MEEKIKQGSKRVNIAKLDSNDNAGDSLTGGYIFAVDKNIWQGGADSGWASTKDTGVYFTYKDPSGTSITPQQKTYIHSYVDSFETALQSPGFANPVTGYRKYIEPTSFIDFFFIQELSKNIDAYRRSAYLYKDKNSKDSRLHAGPHWDYNSAWDAHTCGFDAPAGWTYPMTCWINQSFHVPFWWSRMLQDTNYTHDMKCRGLQLRSTVLDTANIFHIIDSVRNYVGQAQVRHYQQYGFTNNYQSEVDSLKWWVCTRLAGMDANMPGNCWNVGVPNGTSFENSFTIYPNPSASEVNVGFNFGSEKNLKIELYDAIGTCVKKLDETRFYSGSNSVKINLSGYPEGIYFLKITSQTDVFTGKIIRIE